MGKVDAVLGFAVDGCQLGVDHESKLFHSRIISRCQGDGQQVELRAQLGAQPAAMSKGGRHLVLCFVFMIIMVIIKWTAARLNRLWGQATK